MPSRALLIICGIILVLNFAISFCYCKHSRNDKENDIEEHDHAIDDILEINQNQMETMIEGDIKMSDNKLVEMLMAVNQPEGTSSAVTRKDDEKWENGVVCYDVRNSLSNKAKTALEEAIDEIEAQTYVRFEEYKNCKNKADYLRIFAGDGCWSYVGKQGGPQDLSIGNNCGYKDIVAHELLHALGRWHEQSRPDRDNSVTINYDNIKKNMGYNFDKKPWSLVDTQGIDYDYRSIMHYSQYAFAIYWGLPTIITSDPKYQNVIGNTGTISDKDFEHINNLYYNVYTTPETKPLSGLSYVNCYKYSRNLHLRQNRRGRTLHLDTSDEEQTKKAILKCGKATTDIGREYFAMVEGFCLFELSGKKGVKAFSKKGESDECKQRTGNLAALAMSLWRINDSTALITEYENLKKSKGHAAMTEIIEEKMIEGEEYQLIAIENELNRKNAKNEMKENELKYANSNYLNNANKANLPMSLFVVYMITLTISLLIL